MTDQMDAVINEEIERGVANARTRLQREAQEAEILSQLEALRSDRKRLTDPQSNIKRRRLLAKLNELRGE